MFSRGIVGFEVFWPFWPFGWVLKRRELKGRKRKRHDVRAKSEAIACAELLLLETWYCWEQEFPNTGSGCAGRDRRSDRGKPRI